MEPKLLTADRFVDKNTGFLYRYVSSDTEYFRPHFHDYYEVFIMLGGTALHLVNGSKQSLLPGDIVFVRPNDTHDYVSADGKSFQLLNITFSAETADMLFAYLGDGFPLDRLMNAPLPPSQRLTQGELDAIDAKMKSIIAIPPEDTCSLKTNLRVLLFDIFSKYFYIRNTSHEAIPPWLAELCTQMRKSENFTDGAQRMYFLCDKSREHISRSMKKYMGVTVTEFINGIRLNYIAGMLKNSDMSIAEIIFASGFNNISWANEQFKLKYGVTMGQYRKS